MKLELQNLRPIYIVNEREKCLGSFWAWTAHVKNSDFSLS